MKHVVSSSEVPHLWAHQSQDSARNGNDTLYFRGATIYSYGSHFPIASFVETPDQSRVIYFTTETYSVTTARHISMVRHSLPGYLPVFNVPLDQGFYRKEPAYFAGTYRDRIKEASENVARSRNQNLREYRYETLCELVKEANRYCETFKLSETFMVPTDFDELKKELSRIAAEKRSEEKARQAETLRKNSEAIEQWCKGLRSELPWNIETVYLRIEGDEMVTSKGARVPLSHAVALLETIEHCIETRTPYKRNGHTIRIGFYTVDSIDTDGNLRAGCHSILWSQISRIAPMVRSIIPIADSRLVKLMMRSNENAEPTTSNL
jgi:hypothetical protein